MLPPESEPMMCFGAGTVNGETLATAAAVRAIIEGLRMKRPRPSYCARVIIRFSRTVMSGTAPSRTGSSGTSARPASRRLAGE